MAPPNHKVFLSAVSLRQFLGDAAAQKVTHKTSKIAHP